MHELWFFTTQRVSRGTDSISYVLWESAFAEGSSNLTWGFKLMSLNLCEFKTLIESFDMDYDRVIGALKRSGI